MNAYQYASDAKIQEAVTAIGATYVGTTEMTLLQQILVAVATNGGGGGGGGSPGGSSGQVQYNNGGSFGGLTGISTTGGVLQTVAFAGSVSGSATLQAPPVAGTPTITLPSITSTLATLGANGFSGVQTITASALGTTPTAYETLVNSTAAAAGAQQVSPAFVLQGNGWKTNATAASQTVAFQQHVLPIQGAANPTGALLFSSNINGAGASELVRIESSAQISWGTGNNGCMTGALGAAGILIGRYDTGNPTTLNGYTAYIGNYNSPGINIQSTGAYSFASGANNLYSDRDTLLKRGGAAATLQMGEDAASTVNQTFKGPNGSGTNIQGGDLRIAPGRSTGSATAAKLILQGTTPGASGTTAQTLADYVEIGEGSVRIVGGQGLWLANSAQLESLSPTHTLTIYDSTGTQYKLLCVPS